MKPFSCSRLGWLLVLTGLMAGCAQKPTAVPISAALEGAERLERRASAAYSKGDLLSAQKDYQTAAAVYTSLALDAPLATTQLNLAKIEAESGRAAAGLALTDAVLGRANLDAATRLLAHGRAAALSLALHKIADANKHLDAADKLCSNGCDAASALAVMRSESWMIGGNVEAAKLASEIAVQAAKTNAEKANALRHRASLALTASGSALQALNDAEQALLLDQALGASARVIADLSLLAQIHSKTGSAVKAAEYTALEKAAQAAREQLRLK
jgi:tetratricopeptide (TPR) repeat protein